MTGRQVLVQGGLATAALAAAYLVWQRAPELAPDEAIALDIGKNDLVSVRFDDQDKKTWVELTRSADDNGPFVTVHLGPQDKPATPKPPDRDKDKDKDKDKEKGEAKTPERLARGSDAADKLLASFTPLRASRALGVLGQEKLKELGLDATTKRITLALRNGKRGFAIAPAPPGGTLPYLRDETSGKVYLVARALLSDFQAAASLLVERRLHAFRVEEADRLRVSVGTQAREVVVFRSNEQTRLALASTPAEPDAALKTWHDRAFSLWPTEVLGKDEIPIEGSPQSGASYRLFVSRPAARLPRNRQGRSRCLLGRRRQGHAVRQERAHPRVGEARGRRAESAGGRAGGPPVGAIHESPSIHESPYVAFGRSWSRSDARSSSISRRALARTTRVSWRSRSSIFAKLRNSK